MILSDCSDKFRRIILMKLLTKDIFDGQYKWLSKGFLPFCGLHGSIIIIFILIPDSEPPFCSRHYKLQRKKPFGFSGLSPFFSVCTTTCLSPFRSSRKKASSLVVFALPVVSDYLVVGVENQNLLYYMAIEMQSLWCVAFCIRSRLKQL